MLFKAQKQVLSIFRLKFLWEVFQRAEQYSCTTKSNLKFSPRKTSKYKEQPPEISISDPLKDY